MKPFLKRLLYSGLPVPRLIRPIIASLYHAGVWCVEGSAFFRKFFWIEPVLRSIATVGTGLRAECLPYIRGKGQLIIGDRVNLSGRSCFYFVRTQGEVTELQSDKVTGGQSDRGTEVQSCGAAGLQSRETGGQSTVHSSQSTAHSAHSPHCHSVTLQPCHSLPTISIGSHTFIGNACTFSAAQRITIGEHCLISAGVRIHDNNGHPLDPDRRRNNDKIHLGETGAVQIGDNVWIGAGATILKNVTIGANAVVGTQAVVTRDVPATGIVVGNPAAVVGSVANDTSSTN